MGDIKLKLKVLSFLEFAIWGAYLTSMGSYLGSVGLGTHIGWFYATQGIVSLFMPAIMGIIADRWVPAQKLLSLCHLISAIFIAATGCMGMTDGGEVSFIALFSLYAISIAFYMPTLALSYSVSYATLNKAGLDTVKAFPPIRVFGTLGFIISMWMIDIVGFKSSYNQFFVSAAWGVIMALYSLTMPNCAIDKNRDRKTFFSVLGLDAFKLFKQRRMAVFFIFSMLLGGALQISNGYASFFLDHFANVPIYTNTFTVQYPIIMISLSQISEIVCILLIPFFLGKFGIKKVMVIAIFAWVIRFLFFGMGNPGSGVWMFVLSMLAYGVAFDFFNISGSIFVDKEVDSKIRSSAQGLFMLMSKGLGTSIGMIIAQVVVNHYVMENNNWAMAWYIFAAYSFVIGILFTVLFKNGAR